jgi:HlyD family secretion protein
MSHHPLRSRRLWFGLVVVALLVWAGIALARDRDEGARWARVAPRTLERRVEVQGLVEAIDSIDLTAPRLPQMWRFKIAFLAEEGIRVNAGAVVVGFDDTEIQQSLLAAIADRDTAAKTLEKRTTDLAVERERAELTLAEAQAKLRKAQLKTEVPGDVVASIELRTAEVDRDIAQREADFRTEQLAGLTRRSAAELEALRRHLEYSRKRVEQLEQAVVKLQVPAPRAGTVVFKTNWNGDKKKVGDSVWWGEPILQIPDLEKLRAIAQVEEVAAGDVALGQAVTFRLDAHPDRTFAARVARIHRAVQARSFRDPTKVMQVELELLETDPAIMRPGMRLVGELTVDQVDAALAIPLEAVFDHGGRPAVLVERSLGEEIVEPELGRRDNRFVEVLGGLAPGDRVRVDPDVGASAP